MNVKSNVPWVKTLCSSETDLRFDNEDDIILRNVGLSINCMTDKPERLTVLIPFRLRNFVRLFFRHFA
jgi:hypothetical protein